MVGEKERFSGWDKKGRWFGEKKKKRKMVVRSEEEILEWRKRMEERNEEIF